MMPTRATLALTFALGALLASAACGDNSDECGPGTTDVEGLCTVAGDAGMAPACTPGTAAGSDGACVIDPGACQDGTVLVGGACVDQSRVAVDVEEAAEPNGLGILGEPSTTPAGTVAALKAIGSGALVLHGHLTPFEDADGDGQPDGDSDAYLITVAGPTAVAISVAGVGGVEGGFVNQSASFTGPADPLAFYRRIAINTRGAAATRAMLLPAAGTYVLTITDARDLVFGDGAPYGDATSEYYASITQTALPTPTPVALTAGAATVSGVDDLQTLAAYAFTPGTGLAQIAIDPASVAPGFAAAFDVLDAGAYVTTAEPPAAVLGGFAGTETLTIVLDPEATVSPAPQPYTLEISAGSAAALSSTGGTVTQTTAASAPVAFAYDVAADGEILGVALTSSVAVEGKLVDARGQILSRFTALDGHDTFTAYAGYVRHLLAGHYYLVVDDPTATGSVAIAMTSTLTAVTPTPLALGAPAVAAADSAAFGSNLYAYAPAPDTAPWIAFAGTPGVALVAFDAAHATGRLTPITTSAGGHGAEAAPIATATLAATPAGGHVTVDDAPTTYLIDARAPTAAPFTLTVAARAATTVALPASLPDQALALHGTNLYFARTAPGSQVALVAAPTNTGARPALTIAQLSATEAVIASATGTAVAGAQLTALADPGGWIAVAVTGSAAGAYTLTATAIPATGYAVTRVATAFAPVCTAQRTTDVALTRGLSAPLAAPAGFTLFGAPAAAYTISANGWLAFGHVTDAAPTPTALPTAAPTGVIAPLWTALTDARVCAATAGGVATIEWIGRTARGRAVDAEAQLDGATGAIAFIYGPTNADGGLDATVGIEDRTGALAVTIGAEQPGAASTTTATVLTPP